MNATWLFAVLLSASMLQVALCIAMCPEKWEYSENSNYCYRMYDEDSKWPTAEIQCAIRGGHHIAIHDLKENEFLQQMAKSNGHDIIWLGAAQFGKSKEYVWSDHSKFDFENWEDGKRPAYKEFRRCTKMNVKTGKWYQSCCKVPSPFICLKKSTVQRTDNNI